MEIEVPGKKIPLNITPLGDLMDTCLKVLFTKFFSELAKPYPEFMKDSYNDLKANIHSYFDNKIDHPPGRDFLFNNLTIIWNTYQLNGRLGEAQLFWQDILKIVQEWEKTRQKRIHKGSLFFFWSQTAILQGQFDKGFFLIHSAYEEDVLTHNNQLPETPAFKTVSLDYSDKNNFLYDLVEQWTNYLSGFTDNYRRISGRKFTLVDFRNHFLNKPPDRDTLFFFTYTLARFFYFDKQIPPAIIKGNFASLFELNTLFDLVLVIDTVIYSSIKNPGKDDWKFINLASNLLAKSGISTSPQLNSSHLGDINSRKDIAFENTLQEILDQSLIFRDGISPSHLECDVSIAYCLRNYSAHKIGSFPIIRERYNEIRQSLFNVMFLAVETLY